MAKAQLETVEMSRPDGEAIIYVPKRSNFTRIIVTLTRNKNMWLTSLGWRPEEKSVALTCDNTASGLAIKLPKKYTKDIQPEDVIAITCAELGFYGETAWGGTAAAPEQITSETVAPPPAPVAVSKVQGLPSGVAEQGLPASKKLLVSGIAALAVMGVIGVTLIGGGDKAPDVVKQADAVIADRGVPASDGVDTDTVSSASVTEQNRDAAEVIAAEIAAKKDETDRLKAKALQDEKEAALKSEAENAAAARREVEKREAGKKEAEKKEATEKARADKVKAEREAADRKKAAEKKADKARADRRAAEVRKQARDEAAIAEAEAAEAAAQASEQTEDLSVADIKSIQEDLRYMGYYSGAIDGDLTSNTISAINLFKSIFELPEDLEVNETLLRELEKERRLFVKQEPVSAPTEVPPAASQADSIVPEIAPEPPENVEADLSVPNADLPEPVAASRISVPQPSAPLDPVTPTATSGISEPVLLKRPELNYPRRPFNRSSFTDTVTVVVSYDVDISGKPLNVEITSNDHAGMFKADFDKAAVRFAKGQRFEPALRGDTPVERDNLSLTLSFEK